MSKRNKILAEPGVAYAKPRVLFLNEREKLLEKYANKIETDFKLDRTLVSFQANKKERYYRWFKYKEGFSKRLIDYLLDKYCPFTGNILDPFAGSGVALFAACERGWEATGIELLPIGDYYFRTRISAEKIKYEELKKEVDQFWKMYLIEEEPKRKLNHISITTGAFTINNEQKLNRYLTACEKIKNHDVKLIIEFAAFSILEEISFTRKDGQYLRWDFRANRSFGNNEFDKGEIKDFDKAVQEKLNEIINDLAPDLKLELFQPKKPEFKKSIPNLLVGSSLELLPTLDSDEFDLVFTSPPYCNRYDYTRTYALELVFLNQNDEDVKKLRQSMLSCTVENKDKIEQLKTMYAGLGKTADFELLNGLYEKHPAINEINTILKKLNETDHLNNSNIPRMVQNYFYEMLFVIFELHRVLRKGGLVIMVNDNVRYGGEEIPVDLILSDFAVQVGFHLEKIWTLPTGKGNSSQQMGEHGRSELRKCIYIWEK